MFHLGDTDATSPQEATLSQRESAQEGMIHLLAVMAMKGSPYCSINQCNNSCQQAAGIEASSVTCYYNRPRQTEMHMKAYSIVPIEWACNTFIHAHATKVLQVCATLLHFPLDYIHCNI